MTPNPATPPRGTYRISDGLRIRFSEAEDSWVPIAFDELVATARSYGAVITYGELAQCVQEKSGIRTGKLLPNWIGAMLEKVAKEAVFRGEPPLTSLCVHQDGTIGEGYAQAPKSVAGSPGADIEQYAAEHRLLCYQEYALDLPADGGTPQLTAAESNRRRWATAKARQDEPPKLCPTCFIVLPTSGRCDRCFDG